MRFGLGGGVGAFRIMGHRVHFGHGSGIKAASES